MDSSEKQLTVAVAATAITGVIMLLRRRGAAPMQAVAPEQLIDPISVNEIASSFPAGDDSFILSAWDYVGRRIHYQDYGSILEFAPNVVWCRDCLSPTQVLQRGSANCVGASILLASLLRTRLPASRVYMVVGTLRRDSVGGHAWCEVKRQDGNWYVLEATIQPPEYPWLRASELELMYVPEVLVNDEQLTCYETDACPTDAQHKTITIAKGEHVRMVAAKLYRA